MKSAGPPLDADWAIPAVLELVATRFGVTAASVTRLGGEVDLNLAVIGADDRRVVVKVGPADADLDRLRWQHDVLRSLALAPGPPLVPQVLAAGDGSEIVPLEHGAVRYPVRVQTWVPGRIVAELSRHSAELLQGWGRAAGWLAVALSECRPPDGVAQTHHWDALRAPEAIAAAGTDGVAAADATVVQRLLGEYERCLPPLLHALPRQVVHQDLNDFNVLATADEIGRQRISGVLDFGDVLYTARVSELAVAVAYAMLRKADPLLAAAEVVRGYAALAPLTDEELAAVFPIAAARLCVNAVTWTARAGSNPDYARSRMRHTWPTIRLLAAIAPSRAHATFREVLTPGSTTGRPS